MKNTKSQDENRAKRRFWQAHIGAWKKSGLTQIEYCRPHQLRPNQFCYWKKKISVGIQDTVKFVPVALNSGNNAKAQPSDDSGLTIRLGKISIKLSKDFSPSTLVKAVEALGGQL